MYAQRCIYTDVSSPFHPSRLVSTTTRGMREMEETRADKTGPLFTRVSISVSSLFNVPITRVSRVVPLITRRDPICACPAVCCTVNSPKRERRRRRVATFISSGRNSRSRTISGAISTGSRRPRISSRRPTSRRCKMEKVRSTREKEGWNVSLRILRIILRDVLLID